MTYNTSIQSKSAVSLVEKAQATRRMAANLTAAMRRFDEIDMPRILGDLAAIRSVYAPRTETTAR